MTMLLPLLNLALAADLSVGPGQTYTTIGAAVAAASPGDRILVQPGNYAEAAMSLDSATLIFEAANGPGTVTITLASGTELLDFDFSADITWRDLDFDGQGSNRFALVRRSTLTVEGGTFTGVSAPSMGGGISSRDSTISVTGSTFVGANGSNGGLIYVDNSPLTVASSTLQAGDAITGGAIRSLNGSAVTVSGTTFESNTATDGSAIHASGAAVSVSSSDFLGNVATNGTVSCINGASCSITGSQFETNAAVTGALLLADGPGTTTIDNSVFCGTRSNGQDHLRLRSTNASISWSIFYDNRGLQGPLVSVESTASADFVNNHFVGTDGNGNAPVIEFLGSGTMQNNLIAHNSGTTATVQLVTGSATTAYNMFYDNTLIAVDAVVDPSNKFNQDPLVNPTLPATDCSLLALIPPTLSPAIDAGTPGVTDPDGSRVDIGAFTNLTGTDVTDGDDDDGDGFESPIEDCDDSDPSIYPGAPETLCDGIDQDCDPSTGDSGDRDGDGVDACDGDCDDDNPYVSELVDVYFDGDMDGYGRGQQTTPLCGIPLNGSLINGDCDDNDPNTYPGALERPNDGVDNNCDGSLRVDNDGDGAVWDEDCDDLNANRFPKNPEIPNDGKDQDCDGWDGGVAITGGAGFTCGGCTTGGGPATGWPAALLLLLGLRRSETRAPRSGHARRQATSAKPNR